MRFATSLPSRRTRILFLLFLFVAVICFLVQSVPRYARLQYKPKVLGNLSLKNGKKKMPDRTGERIAYNVRFGKVELGSAYYYFEKKIELEGRQANVILFETKVTQFHDLETIYCDPETFLPITINREVSRLVKPEKITEEYDQENFILTITRRRFTTEKTVIKKEKPIHNAILLPQIARNTPELSVGWSFEANLPQRTYVIKLTAIETIHVPAGTFEAYYFESEPRQIKIWISTDEHRVPLKLEGMGAVNYRMEMREYRL